MPFSRRQLLAAAAVPLFGRRAAAEGLSLRRLPRLQYFARDSRGRTLTFSEVTRQYGIPFRGVNAYFGVNREAGRRLESTGAALSAVHRAVLDDALRRLLSGEEGEVGINLGLWPFEREDPYGAVRAHAAVITALARELHAYQERARGREKRLEITVRYASEMNDAAKPGQPWGRNKPVDPEQQEAFRATFREVRTLFREAAPAVRFAFSPALRSDNTGARYAMIADYWPGDDVVDVVSATWYVGRREHFAPAAELLRTYFTERKEKGRPFGLDEMGGIEGDHGNDAMVERMLSTLLDLEPEGITLDYLSLFLAGKWAADARLDFLKPR